VTVVTGLPLAWYGAQRRAFREALTGAEATIAVPGYPARRLWIDQAVVLPQGVAAAGPVLGAARYEPGPYLVVDIGYRTTDYIIVTKRSDGLLDFDPHTAGSLETGTHAINTALAAELSETHQIPFTVGQVEGAGTVVVRGQRIALDPPRQRHRHKVAARIAQGLAESLDARLDQVLGIIAVGGGASLLAGALPGVVMPADPQWANALGYALAAPAVRPLSG
jgi:hypothetical protein